MKRLTSYDEKGWYSLQNNVRIRGNFVDKLRLYEDIGLSPAIVDEMRAYYEFDIDKLKRYKIRRFFDRIKIIPQAIRVLWLLIHTPTLVQEVVQFDRQNQK